jgi:hypothetical protein
MDFCWGLTELSRKTATKAERVLEDNLIAALDADTDTNPTWFRGNDFQSLFDTLTTDTDMNTFRADVASEVDALGALAEAVADDIGVGSLNCESANSGLSVGLNSAGRRNLCDGLQKISTRTALFAEQTFEANMAAALDSNADTVPNWQGGADFQSLFDTLATDTDIQQVQSNLADVTTNLVSLANRVQTLEAENSAMREWICQTSGGSAPSFCN